MSTAPRRHQPIFRRDLEAPTVDGWHTVIVELPIRTYPEHHQRDAHYRQRARRVREKRGAVAALLRGSTVPLPRRPLTVELRRIAPPRNRIRDTTENLQSALKSARDAVADVYEVDDTDAGLIRWTYAQEDGPDYAIRLTFTPRSDQP